MKKETGQQLRGGGGVAVEGRDDSWGRIAVEGRDNSGGEDYNLGKDDSCGRGMAYGGVEWQLGERNGIWDIHTLFFCILKK